MFSAVIDVLEMIIDDGPKSGQRGKAKNLLELMLSFNCVLFTFDEKYFRGYR